MATLPYQRVRKHSFNGKPYRFRWRKPRNGEGLCMSPASRPEDRKIYVNPNSTSLEFLYCLLHECLHAEQFYLDEDTIERVSNNLADIAWRCGYRMVDAKGNIVERIKPLAYAAQ